MYRQVKEAEAKRTKKLQVLQKLQEDLERITRENAKQLKVITYQGCDEGSGQPQPHPHHL